MPRIDDPILAQGVCHKLSKIQSPSEGLGIRGEVLATGDLTGVFAITGQEKVLSGGRLVKVGMSKIEEGNGRTSRLLVR